MPNPFTELQQEFNKSVKKIAQKQEKLVGNRRIIYNPHSNTIIITGEFKAGEFKEIADVFTNLSDKSIALMKNAIEEEEGDQA